MKCQISNQIAPVHKVDYNSSKMKGSKPLTKRKCYYTGARYVFFMSDPFLTGPQFIQPATSPTVFTFLSHSASCLPHAVSRLPNDDATARRPDAVALLPHCLLSSLMTPPARAHPCSSLATAPGRLPPPWWKSGSK